MFQDASRLDHRISSRSLRESLEQYRATASSWFDGTIESIDRRVSACHSMEHKAREATVRVKMTDVGNFHFASIAHGLEQDRRNLEAMRNELVSEPVPVPVQRSASVKLSQQDQSYIDLEAKKFLAHQVGTYGHDVDELLTRAQRHMADQTSTMSRQKARALTASFVNRVEEFGRLLPQQRTATRRTADVENMPDQALFY